LNGTITLAAGSFLGDSFCPMIAIMNYTLCPNGPVRRRSTMLGRVLALSLLFIAAASLPAQEDPPVVIPPKPVPTVPEQYTLQGQFVRLAYNNEGFVVLGYRAANYSKGEEWMLLEVGVTLREGAKPYVLDRGAISIKVPDGTVIPMATQQEYNNQDLRGVQLMADGMRDSINYFPRGVTRPCRLSFFSDPESRGLSFDKVELNQETACLGRVYFRVPGGIKIGQHWLIVQFADGPVEVPFRILTKAEEKEFRKRWQEMKKEHDAASAK